MSEEKEPQQVKLEDYNSFAYSPTDVNEIATWMMQGKIKFVDLQKMKIINRSFMTLAELDIIFSCLLEKMKSSETARVQNAHDVVVNDLQKLRAQVQMLKALVVEHCPKQAVDKLVSI